MEDGSNELVLETISAAVFAGAYYSLAREIPEARCGLERMARKHSARAGTLAGEVCTQAAELLLDMACKGQLCGRTVCEGPSGAQP